MKSYALSTSFWFTVALTCGNLVLGDELPAAGGAIETTARTQATEVGGQGTLTKAAQAAERRRQQIEGAVRDGRISALEAEFMNLCRRDFESPRDRQQAIRAWRTEKGAAFDSEREEKRARLQPLRDARQAEARAHREQQIENAGKSGQMGPLEAEFMTLANRVDRNPQQRKQAIREWQASKGRALAAEIEQKRAALQPTREEKLAEYRANREQQIADAVASGSMSAAEGEFLALRNQFFGRPDQINAAVRAQLKEKTAALQSERSALRGDETK